MKISQYAKEYTAGEPIKFQDVVKEVGELIIELAKFKVQGIKEEFADVFHFLQLWLYSKFKIDGEIWKITRYSVEKFIARKSIWNRIYSFVGLPENISGYVGNYNKIEKIINQLQKLGIGKDRAEEAYREIILK